MRFKLLAIGILLGSSAARAATVLWTDNFNIPDTGSLDGSDQTGRHTGLLANNVVARSGGTQMSITSSQLNVIPVSAGATAGRIRFHDAANLGNRYDFASGAGGAQIIADGGMIVSFDWTSADNTSLNWLAFSVGIPTDDAGGGRPANATTDSGILFRNNGQTQVFDNGVLGTSGSFAVTSLIHHVDLAYQFNSFADGTDVTLNAFVDGTNVATQSFAWDANAGTQIVELGSLASGTRVDNFSISTVPEPSMALLGGAAGLGLLRRRRRP